MFRMIFFVNRNVTHKAFECLKSSTGSKLGFFVKKCQSKKPIAFGLISICLDWYGLLDLPSIKIYSIKFCLHWKDIKSAFAQLEEISLKCCTIFSKFLCSSSFANPFPNEKIIDIPNRLDGKPIDEITSKLSNWHN